MNKKNGIDLHMIEEREMMPMKDYRVTIAKLPTSVRGFVFIEEDGVPRIVLNANLTREQNRRTLDHEVEHIEKDELNDPTYHEYGDDTG